VRQWFALIVGDRNQWHVAEAAIEWFEITQILPAMKRGQGPSGQRAEKREMEQVDMKMKDVEFLSALAHLINHQHEVWKSRTVGSRRSARVQQGANSALVIESSLAKSVTAWP